MTEATPSILDSLKPHWVFLVFALGAGLLFLFLTPPFQTPDETTHFYRAYSVSLGHFNARFQGLSPGDMLPPEVFGFASGYLRLTHQKEEHVTWKEILDSRKVRISKDQRVFHHFPFTALYPPVAFFPQASGIALARLVSDRPFDMFYAARAVNFLVALALMTAAIATAPSLRWTLTLLGLMPMTLYLRSSLSPDAVATGLAFLVFALALRARMRLLTAASAVLSLMKPYGAIAFLALADRKSSRLWSAILVVTTLAATIYLAIYSKQYQIAWGNADPVKQEIVVRNDPMRFLRIVAEDYRSKFATYLGQFVGDLGWLNNPLPWWIVVVFAAVLVIVAIADSEVPVSLVQRIWSLAIAIGLMLVISLSQYVLWTAVGQEGVDGVQGRYFIPIAPLLLLVITSNRVSRTRMRAAVPWIVIATATAALIAAVVSVVGRYYG